MLRVALSLIVPVALLLPVVSGDAASVVWGYGAAAGYSDFYAGAMVAFAPALVFFTVHYLVLRGFYALERNRSAFWVQCVVAVANIVLAVAFTARVSGAGLANALALAYGASYLLGSVVSYLYLRSLLQRAGDQAAPGLRRADPAAGGVAALAAAGCACRYRRSRSLATGKVAELVRLALAGGADLLVLVIGARLVGPDEIVDMVDLVRTRLRRGRHG